MEAGAWHTICLTLARPTLYTALNRTMQSRIKREKRSPRRSTLNPTVDRFGKTVFTDTTDPGPFSDTHVSRVQALSHSMAVIIPKKMGRILGIQKGTQVVLTREGRGIRIEPFDLAETIRQVREQKEREQLPAQVPVCGNSPGKRLTRR